MVENVDESCKKNCFQILFNLKMNNEAENPINSESHFTNIDFTDAEEIKKRSNAFMNFYLHCKDELLKSNENVEITEIDRMIGKMWQVADEETKHSYREQAKQFAELYKRVHPDFLETRRRKISSQGKVPEPIRVKVILKSENDQIIPMAPIQQMTSLQDINPISLVPTQVNPSKLNETEVQSVVNLSINIDNM